MEHQYMNQMDMYEEEIDLKALIIAVLRKWRVLIATGIIFAILFGGLKGLSGLMKLRDPEYVRTQIETVKEAKKQYETQKTLYETQLKTLENEVENLNAYRDRSLYMNIDPYNEYRETVTYYVNTDYQIMPGMDYQNVNQATSILNAYTRQIQDFSIYGKALNVIGKDFTSSDVRELVQVQQDNTNFMFTVTIVGETDEIPNVLMDVVRETVTESKSEITRTIGEHTIQEVTYTSGYGVDTVLSDTKIKFQDNMTKLHDAIAKKQKAITDLAKPSGEVPSKKSVLKQAIKYALMGGFGGGFLAALWACAIFLMGDRMPDETTLKERYGIRTIGSCRAKGKKQVFSFIDSWIDRFEGIKRSEFDEERAYQFAAANLDSCAKDGAKVLLVGTMPEEQLEKVYSKISEYAEQKNYTFAKGGNLAEDPTTVRRLVKADAVVFVESRNESKQTHFIKAIDIIRAQKKEVYGLFFS